MSQLNDEQQARLTEFVERAERAKRQLHFHDAHAAGLDALALLHLSLEGKPESWRPKLAELEPTTVSLLGSALMVMAKCSFRMADYSGALQLSEFELFVRRHAHDELGEAHALYGKARSLDVLGLYHQALRSHFEAFERLERLEPRSMAGPLSGIAHAYLNLGQPTKALSYARRAAEASRGSKRRQHDESTALRITGMAHEANGDLAAAEQAFLASYERADAFGRSLALLSLGELYLEQGRYAEALARYRACVDGLPAQQRGRVLADALVGLGRVYLGNGDAEHALVPLTEAVALGASSGALRSAASAHQAMTQALKLLGRWREALEHHETFHELNERALLQLSDRRTQLLTVQLDVERLEREREVDQLRNVELAQAYADLSELHQQLELQAARLEYLARTDELTGLPNRRAFEERLHTEFQRARRSAEPLSVLMLDLDDFKAVNDTYTHVVGDAVLRTTARALLDCMREVDMCARLGGEEFVVLLPDTDLQGAVRVAEKMVDHVRSHNLQLRLSEVTVTASVGIATLLEDADGDELVARADSMLYQAKRSGKNRVHA